MPLAVVDVFVVGTRLQVGLVAQIIRQVLLELDKQGQHGVATRLNKVERAINVDGI